MLLTTVMVISRIVFSMARSHDLPSLFGRIHPCFSTPHYAIAITGACMIAALLPADLALVVKVSTFAMLVFYLIANIAALRLSRELRWYPSWIPAMGAVSCVGLIAFLAGVHGLSVISDF